MRFATRSLCAALAALQCGRANAANGVFESFHWSLLEPFYRSLSIGLSTGVFLLESFYWSLSIGVSLLKPLHWEPLLDSPLESLHWSRSTGASLYWSLSLLKPLASNRANPTQALERCDRSHSHSLGKSVCHFLCADWLDRCACLFTFERSCKHQPNSRYIIGLKVEFDIAYLPRIFFVNHSK